MEVYTSSNGINYISQNGRSVERVEFDRYNESAGVREIVSVHWTEVFKWADADPCGGLSLKMVVWSDGTKTYASGMYFPDGGLAEVVVGCYGSKHLWRKNKCYGHKYLTEAEQEKAKS